jgi:predicted pyridoxine 5'-phosphate oxidase superfamily flavin-nucleotide-binding protein
MLDRSNVYHEGELFVQELAGQRALAERNGAGIGACIVPGARSFLDEQELLVLAAADAVGEVWASAWFGSRGFAQSRDDGRTLWIDRRKLIPLEADPVAPLLRPGVMLGVLAIELETRRRLRVNGRVQALDDRALALEIRESFANCPKYIAKRHLQPLGPQASRSSPPSAAGGRLDDARAATIGRTDTVFVGSQHPERGADASHRGGEPGFVQVLDEQTLRIPDYSGNGMYQTLGNLHSTGRAGLLFLDFEGRRMLHVTGTTRLHFDTNETRIVTGGTGRSWDLRVTRWVEGALPPTIDAELLERSRFIPR